MAEEPKGPGQRLVLHTPASRADLVSIYIYNLNRYGESHVDAYLNFLNEFSFLVASDPAGGLEVEGFAGVRCEVAKSNKGKSKHGDRFFYREVELGIEVIRVLHTRMDWLKHLHTNHDFNL